MLKIARHHLEKDPKAADWLEVAALAVNVPSEKLAYAQKALTAAPANPRVLTTCAMLALQTGSRQEAVRLSTKAVQLAPQDGRACAVLAACVGGEKASELFAKAIQLSPNDYDVNNLAFTYYEQTMDEQSAEASLRRMTEHPGHASDAFVALAKYKRRAGDLNGAIEAYNKAIKLDPNSILALAGRSKLLAQLGKNDEAQEGFKKWAQLTPASAAATLQLAKGYFKAGKKAEAISSYSAAIKLANGNLPERVYATKQMAISPRDYKSCWIHRMEMLAQTGKPDEAIAQAALLIAVDPTCDAALSLHERIMMERKNYAEALNDLNKLIALDADVSEWYKARADAYDKLNKPDEAAEDRKKAGHIDKFGKI
jgi:tetratricopeptide (TPR) repeat protein